MPKRRSGRRANWRMHRRWRNAWHLMPGRHRSLGMRRASHTGVQELHPLTQEHGYPYWSAQVLIFEGELQLRRGLARAAVTLMRQGLDAYRATGATLLRAPFAILLGDALTQDGRLDEALRLLEDQIAALSDTGELWCAAELHAGVVSCSSRAPCRISRGRKRSSCRPWTLPADSQQGYGNCAPRRHVQDQTSIGLSILRGKSG